jgi:hypothetical protein
MPPALFALVTLETGSCFWPRPVWTTILLFSASHCSWDDRCASITMPSFFLLTWGFTNFFLPGLEPRSSNLSFLQSLGWQIHTTTSNCWLRWGLMNCLPRLVLNHNPPDLSLPSS